MPRQSLQLKANHKWKSKPGYSICVIDRGAVRFDYPADWVVRPGDNSLHLHDEEPSNESCDMGVSVFHLPPGLAAGVALEEMLRESLKTDRDAYEESAVHSISRDGIDIIWIEQKYRDPDSGRDARLRTALARETSVCVITMNYWATKAPTLEPVWDVVLASLLLDRPIADPTVGPVVQ